MCRRSRKFEAGSAPCSKTKCRNIPFTHMRFKPRFSATVQPQRTADNRKYTAKMAKEPYWPQSKRKPPAIFRKTTAAFRRQKYPQNCPRTAAGLNGIRVKGVLVPPRTHAQALLVYIAYESNGVAVTEGDDKTSLRLTASWTTWQQERHELVTHNGLRST